MGRFQCSCGFLAERTPQVGDSIVSVYHLHRSARLDGGTSLVRMTEMPEPARHTRIGGEAMAGATIPEPSLIEA